MEDKILGMGKRIFSKIHYGKIHYGKIHYEGELRGEVQC